MSRSSPSVGRVVAILNFFADHPGQSFTLTDLVRALKLSRATCHALLAGLVEANYLFRASDKSYVLGPALAAIGKVAQANNSPLQVARPEMRALADEFDTICSAYFREGDDVIVRDRAASMSHLGWSIPAGTRLPLRPPFGAIFFAWSPALEAEAWLDSLSPSPSARQRQQMTETMGFAREHGYAYVVRNADDRSKPGGGEWLFTDDQAEHPVLIGSEMKAGEMYRLASLVAPVFGADRRVAFTIGLNGFGGVMAGHDIEAIGRRLRAACDRVTDFTAGTQPATGRA